jgi:D-alanyl-D-alanine carboxypeptidase/D-alanyl-D-alanine-endopeptidase (penicillin-binding protein 4)
MSNSVTQALACILALLSTLLTAAPKAPRDLKSKIDGAIARSSQIGSALVAQALACILALLPTLLTAAPKAPHDLKSRIDAAIARSTQMESAFIGIRVVSLADGGVLYERNQDHLFAPASNTKLFTTALALTTLGSRYRFTTSVIATQPLDAAGRLAGDLIFAGGGDPSLSPRHYPYEKPVDEPRPKPFDTIAAIEEFAGQLVAHGLKSVEGDVVGDDRRYLWQPYPDGWSENDPTWEYGAPVSALIVNDNAFTLSIRSGDQPGDLARIQTSPSLNLFAIDNRVNTIAQGERRIHVQRGAGSHELQIWGEIPVSDRGMQDALAVDDPAVFAAAMLRDALIRRGVAFRGGAVARHRHVDEVADRKQAAAPPTPAAGVELARRTSPPLIELLQVVDKVSQNLHAEVMLREVGAVKRNIGSSDAGQEEMKAFLSKAGIGDKEFHIVDGSGLSRLTLVTPAAITGLLVHMYRSPHRDEWMALLPIAGVDGTLNRRFEGHPEARRIQAKTGSLSHVRAMSGYADSKTHGPLAFSILVNDSLATSRDLSRFLDTIGLKLIE